MTDVKSFLLNSAKNTSKQLKIIHQFVDLILIFKSIFAVFVAFQAFKPKIVFPTYLNISEMPLFDIKPGIFVYFGRKRSKTIQKLRTVQCGSFCSSKQFSISFVVSLWFEKKAFQCNCLLFGQKRVAFFINFLKKCFKKQKSNDFLNVAHFEIQKNFGQYLSHFMSLTMKRQLNQNVFLR